MFDGLKSLIDVRWLSETVGTETTKKLIKPLSGPNYATWNVQCKMALIKEGLWNIVTENENALVTKRSCFSDDCAIRGSKAVVLARTRP